MLKFFRKHTKTWFVWIFFGTIIFVFVFFGIGTIRQQRGDFVAKVNDDIITRSEFSRAYNNAIKNYQSMYGDALSEEVIKKLNVEKMVLNSLITQSLTRDAADRLGVTVGDDELRDYIRSLPAFAQDGGGFSEERYRALLKNVHMTPADFESAIRRELIMGKVGDTISHFAKVSDAEVKDAFEYANRQIKLDYVAFKADSFKERVKADAPAIQAYFKTHQEEYRVPPKVKVRLASFLFKNYTNKVKITPADIESYYKENSGQFREPEKRRLSHVFFSVQPSATPEQITQIETRARDVIRKAKAGEDFSGLVKQYSEDKSSLKTGGDLGYLRRGMTDASLEDAVFSLQKGDISDIVRSKMGLHVIKVTDVVPSKIRTLPEVSSQIEKILSDQKSQEMARVDAEREYSEIIKEGGLNRYASIKHRVFDETPFFSASEEIPGIGKDATFSKAALVLKKGESSSLIKSPQGYFICEVTDRKESFIPSLNDIRVQVASNYAKAESLKMAEGEARQFISELKNGKPFAETAAKHSTAVKETEFFNPAAPTGVEFLSPANASDVARLTPTNSFVGQPLKAGETYYVTALAGTKDASKELFAQQSKIIKESLLQAQKKAIVKGWVDGLNKKAKIEVGEEFKSYLDR